MNKTLVCSLLCLTFVCQILAEENTKCGDSLECLEKELVSQVDVIEQQGNIGGLVSLKKSDRSGKSVKGDEDLFERCLRFLRENELRVGIPDSEKRSIEAESRTKRLRKMILPLILLLKLKAAIIIPIVLSAISFVAFAGLKSGLAAFLISGAVAFKSFLESHGQSKVSYEIVPTPHWSRTSIEDTLPIAGYQTIA
ncbi:uncharacterized protein LOC114324591 [Diabrotica virgifera virgifera]|uniref:Uncharacterized protein n=1 Tax=Diabrotica virgifera virgifera TaxID=50390 RepID=A0ABM5I9Z0_DIAVI|nr:uncharacterized protein LOC114324591 [Diabrotica virgifera virgifera]